MELLLAFLASLFAFPALTGYFAHRYGRSFWLWFVLAMVLPLVSWVLPAFLVWRQERKVHKQQLNASTPY